MGILPAILGWAVWFGATGILLRVDAARQRAAAAARGEVDFMERSPSAFLGLALLCGPLPLLVYFWSTRRSALGLLLGVAWAAVVTLVAGAVMVGVTWATAPAPPSFETRIEASATPTPFAPPPKKDELASAYLDALRDVAAKAKPICERHPHPPVDNAPSPAKGTALERDPRVVSLEVWCVRSPGEKIGFASLKDVPDVRRLSGIWPQERHDIADPRGGGALTTFVPSGAIDHANQLRYLSDAGVEVDLDVTP